MLFLLLVHTGDLKSFVPFIPLIFRSTEDGKQLCILVLSLSSVTSGKWLNHSVSFVSFVKLENNSIPQSYNKDLSSYMHESIFSNAWNIGSFQNLLATTLKGELSWAGVFVISFHSTYSSSFSISTCILISFLPVSKKDLFFPIYSLQLVAPLFILYFEPRPFHCILLSL